MAFGFGFGLKGSGGGGGGSGGGGSGSGGGPTLDLDFLQGVLNNPELSSNTVSFTRNSNATFFNSAGVLMNAPNNLLTFSEQFDNAVWTTGGTGAIAANVSAAPDDTRTADELTTSGGTGSRYQSVNVSAGLTYTFSVYVKLGTMLVADYKIAIYNNTAAAFIAENITPTQTLSSTAWVRVTYEFVIPAGCSSVRVYPFRNGSAINSSTVLFWGAQLNIGALQPYNSTTVKNLLGFSQEFDNAAWTKSNSFVQTNQIRNNTMQGAVAGTPGTVPTNWAVSTAAGITRQLVGVGVEDGVTYVDYRFSGTATGPSDTQFDASNFIAALSGQTWTSSAFVKLQAGSLTNVTVTQILAENNSGGGFLAASTQNITPTSAGLQTQRPSLTRTLNNASTAFTTTAIRVTSAGAIDITLRIGLPQLVQGATAGDVVQTFGTARAVMYPAPDGSITADKLVANTTVANHYAQISAASIAAGAKVTSSAYIKAAGYNFVRITAYNAAITAGFRVDVNLSTGVGVTSTFGAGSSASGYSVIDVGNGWYRISATGVADSSSTSLLQWIQFADNASMSVFAGNGTSGIFIWGAQLSDSASLDPYVYNPVAAPASTAYYGPRFDHNPSTLAPLGLLIEEQRTNSIRNNMMVGAAAGTPGTLPTNWGNALAGLTQTVVGTGIEDGITYVDIRLNGTTISTSAGIRFETNTGVAVAPGQTWTVATFGRLVGGSSTNIVNFSVGISGLNAVGVSTPDAAVASMASVINSDSIARTRTSRALTYADATTAFARVQFIIGFSVGVAIDITLRIGMPQLEQGAFATSVIPTSLATATRALDVATMIGANFSNWYNQSEGTLFAQYIYNATGISNFCAFSLDNGTSGESIVNATATPNIDRVLVSAGGSSQANFGNFSYAVGQVVKRAVAVKLNDAATTANGSAVATDNTFVMPIPTQLVIGAAGYFSSSRINGYIQRIAYYPRRLSNAELQAITA
jgi:hypothetical protein